MKKYLILMILSLIYSKLWANEYIDEVEFKKPTIFEIQAEEKKQHFDQLVEKARDYSIMNNKIYENDKIRIYNHSLFEFESSVPKMTAAQSEPAAVKDLKFSIGYGLEYKIDKYRKVGYEYVSNYPYDRGQIIRLFWNRTF